MKFSQEAFEKQNALDVMAYWHKLGYRNVTCDALPYQVQLHRADGMKEVVTLWRMVSNLINGCPPGIDPHSLRIPEWERKPLRESTVVPLQWPATSLLRPPRRRA